MMKIKNKYAIKILSVAEVTGFGFVRFYSVTRELAIQGKSSRFSPNLGSNQNTFNFDSWIAGFSDAESSLIIVSKQDSKGNINRYTFMFVIGLHLDDYEALKYIKNKL